MSSIQDPNISELEQQEVQQWLKERRTLVLSTVSRSGEPACAPLYYSSQRFSQLDFVSKSDSQHCLNSQECAKVAGAIYKEGQQLSDICGVQLRGHITALKGQSAAKARLYYLERYPGVSQTSYLVEMFNRTPIYRFHIHWIRFTDHQDGKIRRRQWTC